MTLVNTRTWKPGDSRWSTAYHGRTYSFSTPAERQVFLAQPERYSPVLSGNDPVLALDKNQAIAGRRQFGLFCDGRIYLFASEASRAAFERNPNRYAANLTPRAPPQLPAGQPPLGLDGYCPVTLVNKRTWELGDSRWSAAHQGRTYLFPTSAERQVFLAQPERYSPVLAGNDPVLALDESQAIAGQRQFGVFCNGHVFLFASEASRAAFERNPDRYAPHNLKRMDKVGGSHAKD